MAHADAALVTARTACEVCSEQTITQLFWLRDVTYLREPVEKLLPSYNLSDKRVRQLYDALAHDDIASQSSFWPQFQAMSESRNKFIHAGKSVTAEEAARSLEIARQLIAHLNATQRRIREELKEQAKATDA